MKNSVLVLAFFGAFSPALACGGSGADTPSVGSNDGGLLDGNASVMDGGTSTSGCTQSELTELEGRMTTALQAVVTDHSFYVELQRPSIDDRVFKFARAIDGALDADTTLQSASTAKMVTAAVILDVVANPARYGTPGAKPLTLDSLARDFLPDGAGGTLWRTEVGPLPAANRLNDVTLRHLLSFTSGLELEKAMGEASECFPNPETDSTHAACITHLVTINATRNNAAAGPRTFYYNGGHMVVAAKMASNSVGAANWAEIFKRFKEAHSVFQGAVMPAAPAGTFGAGAYFPYADGNATPSPAGALRYRAGDYASFLKKLGTGQIIPAALLAEMLSNQVEKLGAATEYSPVTNDGEDWRYGLGLWNECIAATYSPACFEGRYSSTGSFGSYPFLDKNVFDGASFPLVGFVGRGGNDPGTGSKGIAIYRSMGGGKLGVKDMAQQWAANKCR